MTWTERRTYARYNGSHFEVGALSDLTLVCVCRFDVLVKNSDNVSRAELVSFVYGMKRKKAVKKYTERHHIYSHLLHPIASYSLISLPHFFERIPGSAVVSDVAVLYPMSGLPHKRTFSWLSEWWSLAGEAIGVRHEMFRKECQKQETSTWQSAFGKGISIMRTPATSKCLEIEIYATHQKWHCGGAFKNQSKRL